MADKRTTSAAKEVKMESYTEHLLSVYGETTADFNEQSREAGQSGNANEAKQESRSSMVREDAPSNDNRPPPEMAEEQDRKTFNEKWKAEQGKAAGNDEYAQHIIEAFGNDKDLHNDQGRDYDNDYSR